MTLRITPRQLAVLRELKQDGQCDCRFLRHHPRTLRALQAADLIKPAEFTPAFPVPVVSRWRVTAAGRKVLAANPYKAPDALPGQLPLPEVV